MIRQCDALDLLAGLEPESVHAVISDPPYCSGGMSDAARRSRRGKSAVHGKRSKASSAGWIVNDSMGTEGLVWLLREVARASVRVLVPGGSLVLFVDWRLVPSVEPALESAGLRWAGLVVWDKQAIGLGSGFRHSYELALHYTRGGGDYHAKDVADLIRAKRVKRAEQTHPTEKPVDLLRPMVRLLTPPGGVVVDPFAGTGATGVAATLEGRSFIGCDLDPGFVEVARGRVRRAAKTPFALDVRVL